MTDRSSPGQSHEPEGPGDSILDALARRTGRSSRVSLRDARADDPAPLIAPESHGLQKKLSKLDQGKYRILGEIAQGGMGVVLRGHDLELGRDVAMKIVDANLSRRPEVIERFVEEAQIGGQLQHPGIVPVYELGLLEDERPYFTMKLIKGRTLAAMMSRRESVDENRARILNVFESVCQTMAYAHSKGVIHRDLKPANIMVGAFGEVQVVDWGLSKVLREGGATDEPGTHDSALTVIETVRSASGAESGSIVGSVLGTPAYMSPEQARGEIAKLDERTDVFALGAILCEILTGKPPYTAAKREGLVQLAAMAELDEARARIDACSAAQELKKLCKACLMPSRAARPRDAEAVADAVHEHAVGLEQRAHEERLNAERSRRHAQIAILVGVLLLVTIGGGGGGWWWVDRQQRERHAELSGALDEVGAEVLRHERDGDLERALISARGGLRLVESADADAELRERASALVETTEERSSAHRERLAAVVREQALIAGIEDLAMRQTTTGGKEKEEEIDAEYRRMFLDFGVDLEDPDLVDMLEAHRYTPLGIKMAQGFDSWARILRSIEEGREKDGLPPDDERIYEIEHVTGIGLDFDPDPTRAEVRLALVARDAGPLLELARSEELDEFEPETLFALGQALLELEQEQQGLRVLTRGADHNPVHFPLLAAAGIAQNHWGDPILAEIYLRAAATLRPKLASVHFRLTEALFDAGDFVGGVTVYETARRLAPTHDWNDFATGVLYLMVSDFDTAEELFETYLVLGWSPSYEAKLMPGFTRALAGKVDREEYFAQVEALGDTVDEGVYEWALPSLLLTSMVPAGLEPQPERALELLEPFLIHDPESADYWVSIGTAYAQTGNGHAAISAGRKLETRVEEMRGYYRALAMLLIAAGHAVEGDRDAADAFLERAHRLRGKVDRGRSGDWETGQLFDTQLAVLESIVMDR